MYPVGMCDIMEFIENRETNSHLFTYSGIPLPGKNELCAGLIDRLSKVVEIPPLLIHLHKNIPPGTGLGGGSSDVVFLLESIVENYNLPLSFDDRNNIAVETGSDCPFFLYNRPMVATGRGEVLSEAHVSLKDLYLLLVIPGIHIKTKQAYSGIKPSGKENIIANQLISPVEQWKESMINQFEEVLFPQYPVLKQIKDTLYSMGALYASMTGSGSGIYGIFDEEVEVPPAFNGHLIYQEILK
jgi:4-diphosphocytidyl-2-C-methyl-D-erythritol kinase